MNAAPSDLDEVLVTTSRPDAEVSPVVMGAGIAFLWIALVHLPEELTDARHFATRSVAGLDADDALRVMARAAVVLAEDHPGTRGATELLEYASRVALWLRAAKSAAWFAEMMARHNAREQRRAERLLSFVGLTARADIAPVQCPDQLAGARCEKVAGHSGPHWNGSAWASVGAGVEPRWCCTYHASGGEEPRCGRNLASLDGAARVA